MKLRDFGGKLQCLFAVILIICSVQQHLRRKQSYSMSTCLDSSKEGSMWTFKTVPWSQKDMLCLGAFLKNEQLSNQ
ncbi:hypothetical protein Nmel_010657 [Mimus melanotis]